MADWHRVLARLTHDVEKRFDALKYELARKLGTFDPIQVLPYRGFGSRDRLYLTGRVLEDEGIKPSADNDSVWRNLVNSWRRIESDEVPHARVRARFHDAVVDVRANQEGFFELWLEPEEPAPTDRLWHDVSLQLLDPEPEEGKVQATGQVLVPAPRAELGIISDIDDTVLQSHVGQLVRMARTLFLGNARTRLPFPGVAAFYRALQDGASGAAANPLFFVSSSPWNLYDLLMEFFELEGIPKAPIFLRNWGVTREEILPVDNREHKMESIRRLLDFYDRLPFILIGDSGQEDPEIYHEIVHAYPERILAVYIRNVSSDLKRPEQIETLGEEVLEAGSTLVLAADTLVMARHAAGEGWIEEDQLAVIEQSKEQDEAEAGLVEELLGDEGEISGEGKGATPVIVEGRDVGE